MGHMGEISMDAVMRVAMDFENLNNLLERTVSLKHVYEQAY